MEQLYRTQLRQVLFVDRITVVGRCKTIGSSSSYLQRDPGF